MAYDTYTGNPDDEQAKVAYLLQLFQYARTQRINFEVQWEEGAAIVWPEYRNSWAFGHIRAPGVKYTQYQVDSTATVKAGRFAAIADALLTPHNMLWSKMEDADPYMMKQRAAKLYYEDVTRTLWNLRYSWSSGFLTSQQTGWRCLGVFGNHGMMIDKLDPGPGKMKGLRYMLQSPGEIYLLQNHQGLVDGAIRHFRWTARQAYQRWGDRIPPVLKAALDKGDVYTMWDFLEFIIPRTDYDPHKMFSPQGKPWASIYVARVGYSILEESGYYTFPIPVGRYTQAPEEWYGRGPTQEVLPALKSKNSVTEAFIKQAGLAGDPAYLLPEDGLFDFKAVQGSYNYGGMSADGKKLVGTLEPGNIQANEKLMAEFDKSIDAAYLVDLFPMLFDKNSQQRSAREVIEVANQMGIFLAPTLGRQLGEYLGTFTQREYDVARRAGFLPPIPDVMKEAGGGRPHAIFTGPLARALNSQGISGFMRSVEMAQQVSNAQGGDPEVFDAFDFDTAIPEIAEMQYAPSRWMASAKQIAQRRQGRAQQAERERQSKELPGRAAIMKAQAIAAKAQAGQNIGGTLSGMPDGGMPQVQGGPQGMPGRPGVNGQPGMSGMPA